MKERFVTIVLALVFLVSACGAPVPPEGEVYILQTGTTLYNIVQVLEGNGAGFVLARDGSYLLVWPVDQSGIGFTMLNESGKPVYDWFQATGGKAMYGSYRTMQTFIQDMKEQGWQAVSASQVPGLLRTNAKFALNGFQSGGNAFAEFSTGMITVFIVPVDIFPTQNSLENWLIENYTNGPA